MNEARDVAAVLEPRRLHRHGDGVTEESVLCD